MRLIDADKLINRMYYEAFENDESYNETNPMARWDSGLWIRYKMFENAIDEQPTIEPKRGKWIAQKGGGFRCSECGQYALDEVDGRYIHVAFKSNFCPYCGAKMDGERKEGE